MTLTTREQSGILIAAASGRIDHTSSEAFGKALEPLIKDCRPGNPALLLDFSGVDYISSAGLRVLLSSLKLAAARNGAFALVAPQETVREVLEMSGFTKIFLIVEGSQELA